MPAELFQFVHPASGCARCPKLVASRHNIVWASGPPQAEVMFIGEAPGANEDREGLPFFHQAAAGRELNAICREAGFNRDDVHVANRVMCHPEGNRDPEPDELANCEPWLVEHVRAVNPKAVVLFGRYAISWLFDRYMVKDTQGLMYLQWCDWCGRKLHEGHRPMRIALDGDWTPSSQQHGPMRRRLVAAIYHPASVLGGRNPEHRPQIVHQLKRVKQELAKWES